MTVLSMLLYSLDMLCLKYSLIVIEDFVPYVVLYVILCLILIEGFVPYNFFSSFLLLVSFIWSLCSYSVFLLVVCSLVYYYLLPSYVSWCIITYYLNMSSIVSYVLYLIWILSIVFVLVLWWQMRTKCVFFEKVKKSKKFRVLKK